MGEKPLRNIHVYMPVSACVFDMKDVEERATSNIRLFYAPIALKTSISFFISIFVARS